jgi:hypothetical protein
VQRDAAEQLIKVEPALLRVWIVSVEANKEAPLATAGLFFFDAARCGRYGVDIDLQLSAGNRRQSRSVDGAAGVRGAAIGR